MNEVFVIVPFYNVERYLSDCIDSILANDRPNISLTIILIDDGSVDESLQIAESYDEHEGIVLLRKENGGQSSARNYGLDYIYNNFYIKDSSLVFFVDSDDMISNSMLSSCIEEIKARDVDMVMFESNIFYDENYSGDLISSDDFYKRKGICFNKVVDSKEIFKVGISESNYIVQPCLYIVKAKYLFDLRFEEGIIYEDNLFTTKLLLNRRNRLKLSCIAESLYHRRFRNDSTVTKKPNEFNINSYIKVFDILTENELTDGFGEYYKYCSNILSLIFKTISMSSLSCLSKSKYRLIVIKRMMSYPHLINFRVIASLFLGPIYPLLVKMKRG